MSDVWIIPDREKRDPKFPFSVTLEPNDDNDDCTVILEADGTFRGNSEDLGASLINMAAGTGPGGMETVVFWLLLCEMRRQEDQRTEPTITEVMMAEARTDRLRVKLGELIYRIQDAVLSQGFDIDRSWLVGVMEELGLMREEGRAVFRFSALATECVDAYRATQPEIERE